MTCPGSTFLQSKRPGSDPSGEHQFDFAEPEFPRSVSVDYLDWLRLPASSRFLEKAVIFAKEGMRDDSSRSSPALARRAKRGAAL